MRRVFGVIAAAILGMGSYPQSLAQTAPAEAPAAEAPAAQKPPAETAPVPATPAETPAAPSTPLPANLVYLSKEASYADVNRIDQNILAECQLPQRQAEFIAAAATRAGFNVVHDEQAVKARKGRVLHVEIVDAISSGNAFIGHRKLVTIRGRLFEDGKEVGDFQGRRSSMGGAFGGFKGSCTVLERCSQTLAGDVTRWLKIPVAGARIGE